MGHGRPPLPSAAEIAALPPDGGPEFNRLVFESSPYLLQHARNPVDWYPWGDAAFARARAENKPLLLSVGYSTCHWCHVMEVECFEQQDVADILNEYYVCIKVDREERPDIDSIYVTAAQVLNGHAGWPNNVWLLGCMAGSGNRLKPTQTRSLKRSRRTRRARRRHKRRCRRAL
jgi:hypothetical protein